MRSHRFSAISLVVALAGCSSATSGAGRVIMPAGQAKPEQGPRPYNQADVNFMAGMVSHHAQAILMAGWAKSHGASSAIVVLCERIVVSQVDEIALLRTWLEERKQAVPETDGKHFMMAGMDHELHPGMLTAAELKQLDAARGTEFDRLFLQLMIKHHQGALTMVDALLGSNGAAQDEFVYKMASDIYADQSSEIERMHLMLSAMAEKKGQ